MKTTFRSDEIAHVWSNQSAPYGKCPSNMSFEDGIFFSYNTAIARHITSEKGEHAVILNERSFSVSTSQHQNIVRRALRGGVKTFRFDAGYQTRLVVTGRELFEYALTCAADAQAKAAKARTNKDWHLAVAHSYLSDAKEINAFFGLRKKVDEKAIQRLTAAKERAAKLEAKREKARREKEEQEMREKMDAWIRGEDVSTYGLSIFPVQFRVEGEELVSSKGARVPILAARLALRFIHSKRGAEWRANGEQCEVGMYRLDSITPAGIVAGCHRITWEEIERVETLLA